MKKKEKIMNLEQLTVRLYSTQFLDGGSSFHALISIIFYTNKVRIVP